MTRFRILFMAVFATALLALAGTTAMAADTPLSQTTPIVWTEKDQACDAGELADLQPGEVLWHFILEGTSAPLGTQMTAVFLGSPAQTVPSYKLTPAGTMMWNIITPGPDTLVSASTPATGGRFNLSHTCREPANGSLTVTKRVVGDTFDGFSKSFDVTVTCTDPSNTYNRTLTWPGADASKTIDNIPAGSQCSVAEGDLPKLPDGYSWGDVEYSAQPVTIPSGGTAELVVKNTLINDRRGYQDLIVSKTAVPHFTRTYHWTIVKSADEVGPFFTTGAPVAVGYHVVVSHDAGTDSDFFVTGTVTVRNPNPESIPVRLSDATDVGGDCVLDDTSVTVPGGDSVGVGYRCDWTGTAQDGTNTATATWNQEEWFTPNGSASGDESFAFTTPTRLVDEQISISDDPYGPLGVVSVDDPNPTSIPYSIDWNGRPGTCVNRSNTATFVTNDTGAHDSSSVSVEICQGADLLVDKTATTSFLRTYDWTIEKTSDVDRIITSDDATFNYTVKVTKSAPKDSDFVLEGDITITNPNDFQSIKVSIVDDPGSFAGCTLADDTVTVAVSGSETVHYTCVFEGNPGSGTNVATVAWDAVAASTPSGQATGDADYAFDEPTTVVNDAIDVDDTVGGSHHFADSGTWEYPYTWSGDEPGTCTSHRNTASIRGLESVKPVDKDVLVCVGADLAVIKDATPTYTRTYTWDVSKAVDTNLLEGFTGSGTFNYTVRAWQTGSSDSGWAVGGTITVTNPNDFEPITATLSDAIGSGCSVNPTSVTVAALGSETASYTCSFDANPGSGTNTATATWDADAAGTPSDSASGSADFAFGAPTTLVDETLAVTDSYAGNLGTLTATDAPADPASGTYRYPRAIEYPANDCQTYGNVATITTGDTGTTDTASQSVRICGPGKTGALTIGYWQNKNGQGIITSGASTAGVCNSATYLRSFAPFQDLGSTATCAQVGTWVLNVIKAANASGASMNAMLKAQMLATALDVYFSDPALGGNRIGAPAPLGGKTIDLTRICKNIGGGCTTVENVSSAFGGATSLTVSQMLAYASSQSNAGGSAWYGQVKATQELAKDAFDAINNAKAFVI